MDVIHECFTVLAGLFVVDVTTEDIECMVMCS